MPRPDGPTTLVVEVGDLLTVADNNVGVAEPARAKNALLRHPHVGREWG